MNSVRWGMIGCGEVAEKRSGPAFQTLPNSSLVAVMRRTPGLAADYARRHGVPRWSDDAQDLIGAPDIDALYIATYPDSHLDYARRAAAAGKAVYVEKPMAMDHAECLAMITACRTAGVPLWVAHYRRALPRFLKIRDLIADGAIGDVRLVRSEQWTRLKEANAAPRAGAAFSWRLDPRHNPGGRFYENVCHTLDLFDHLFGPVTEVGGNAVNMAGAYEVPDTITANYRFASGVQGCGVWCYATDREYEMNEIVGSEGRLLFPMLCTAPVRLIRGDRVTEFAIQDPPVVAGPLIETIAHELTGTGTCPSTGESAARTVRVLERILASAGIEAL